MDIKNFSKISPFIVHGTDLVNISSILEQGLWSASTLKEKGVEAYHVDPLMQKLNKRPKAISVSVYDKNKETFDSKKGSFPIGKLDHKERVALIKGEHILARHVSYDVCIILNPKIKYEVPKKHDFQYEAFVDEIGELNKNNVIAVVLDKEKILSDIYPVRIKDAIKIIDKLSEELKNRGIPFIEDGWKVDEEKKLKRDYNDTWR